MDDKKNWLKVEGILSKSTKEPTEYFFKISSQNLDMLKVVMNQCEWMLDLYGYFYEKEEKYHG